MAIAQETVRLKQAVKSTYRVAIERTEVAGVEVVPGTVVQAYWHPATLATGPGVEEFRPGYWLSEDRRTCSINDDPNSMQVRFLRRIACFHFTGYDVRNTSSHFGASQCCYSQPVSSKQLSHAILLLSVMPRHV